MAMIFWDETQGGVIFTKKDEPTKWRVDFDELTVKREGTKTHLYFWAIACDAYACVGKKDPGKGKKWEAPSKLYACIDSASEEKGIQLISKVLESLEEGKCYKGSLSVDGAMLGADKYLADETQLEVVGGMLLAAMPVEFANLNPEELTIPKARGGGNWGSKSESTAERIAARMAFLKSLTTDDAKKSELEELWMALSDGGNNGLEYPAFLLALIK